MNYKKPLVTGLILTLGLFLATGCIGPFAEDEDELTPGETVESFLNMMNEGNAEKAEGYLTENFIQEHIGEGGIEEQIEQTEGTIDSLTIKNEEIHDEKAVVSFQLIDEGREFTDTYELIRKDGYWKINDIISEENDINYETAETSFIVNNCFAATEEVIVENTGEVEIDRSDISIWSAGKKIGELDFTTASGGQLDVNELAAVKINLEEGESINPGTIYEVVDGEIPSMQFTC